MAQIVDKFVSDETVATNNTQTTTAPEQPHAQYQQAPEQTQAAAPQYQQYYQQPAAATMNGFTQQVGGQTHATQWVGGYQTAALSTAGMQYLESLVHGINAANASLANCPFGPGALARCVTIDPGKNHYAVILGDYYVAITMVDNNAIPTNRSVISGRVIESIRTLALQQSSLAGCSFLDAIVVHQSDYDRVSLMAAHIYNLFLNAQDPSLRANTYTDFLNAIGGTRAISVEANDEDYDDFVDRTDPHSCHPHAQIKLVVYKNVRRNYNSYDRNQEFYEREIIGVVGAYFDFVPNAQSPQLLPQLVITNVATTGNYFHEGIFHVLVALCVRWSQNQPKCIEGAFIKANHEDAGGILALFARNSNDTRTAGGLTQAGMVTQPEEVSRILNVATTYGAGASPDISLSIPLGRAAIPGFKKMIPDNAVDENGNQTSNLSEIIRNTLSGFFGIQCQPFSATYSSPRPREAGGIVEISKGVYQDIRYYSAVRAYTDMPTKIDAIYNSYFRHNLDATNVVAFLADNDLRPLNLTQVERVYLAYPYVELIGSCVDRINLYSAASSAVFYQPQNNNRLPTVAPVMPQQNINPFYTQQFYRH